MSQITTMSWPFERDIGLLGPAIEEEGYDSVVPRANAAFKAIWE
jgi:hypothetical protein